MGGRTLTEPGPRLGAIRRAEVLVRELAGIRDQAELTRRGRELVREARAVVLELEATSRERRPWSGG